MIKRLVHSLRNTSSVFHTSLLCVILIINLMFKCHGQSVTEVLSNPEQFDYVIAKSILVDNALPLVRDKRDSAFVLLDTLANLALNKGLPNDASWVYQMKAETYFMQDQSELAKSNFVKAIEYSINDKKNLLRLHSRASDCYRALAMLDSAMYHAQISKELLLEVKDSSYYSRMYIQQGDIATINGQYITALDFYQKAENFGDYVKTPVLVRTESLSRQSETYASLGDLSQAINYQEKSVSAIEGAPRYALTLCNRRLKLATYYTEVKRFDEALDLFIAIEKCYESKDLPQRKLALYSKWALAYLGKGDIPRAELYISKAKSFLLESDAPRTVMLYHLIVGKIKTAKNESTLAIESLNRAKQLAIELGDPHNHLKIYETSMNLAERSGDDDQTLRATKRYYEFKDSLFTIQQANLGLDYEARYNRKEQEKSISELNMKNDVQALTLKQQHKQFYWFTLLLAGLLGLLYMAYVSYNRRKKNEILLSQKNEEITRALDNNQLLLKEIHHRVKNNLQVVSSILSLQSRQISDPKAQKVIKAGQDRIKSMALIHQNLHQSSDLLGVSAKSYMEELIFGLSKTYNVTNDKIKVDIEVADIKLDIDSIIPLGLIANELISNAMKYAFPNDGSGSIQINLQKVDQNIHFSVSDDGAGLPDDFDFNSTKSLGFRIVSSFTKKLKGQISFLDKQKGATILLSIPEGKLIDA